MKDFTGWASRGQQQGKGFGIYSRLCDVNEREEGEEVVKKGEKGASKVTYGAK